MGVVEGVILSTISHLVSRIILGGMGTGTVHETPAENALIILVSGLVSGLVGGIVMGGILHAGSNLMPLIGAIYGEPTVMGGWISHLLNSAFIGVLFAVIITRPTIRTRIGTVTEYLIAGVLYATTVGIVTAGIMLPITMNVTGTHQLPEPAIAITGLIGEMLVVISVGVAHIAYGFVLGSVFYFAYSPTNHPSPDT